MELMEIKNINKEVFNDYIRYLDTTPKTVDSYKKALKQLYKFLAVNNISQPKRPDIIAFKEQLKDAGRKPATIQFYITAIKLFFKWCEMKGVYPNIAEHIKGAKVTKEHKKDYLTSNQIKIILESIDTSTETGLRDYTIILLMVIGGLRTIEVARANIEDINTLGNSTVLYIQGKGKEEKADFIKLPYKLESVLKKYLMLKGPLKKDYPIFSSTSNNNKGQRLTTRSISGIVKARLRNAGYDDVRLTAHSLRHTAITLALLQGRDITEVQQFARHSNINTTMIYNHALEKEKNGCSEAIAKLFF